MKKYYLLAVLGMATNMIVMNEVNAMNQQNIDELDRCKYLGFPLNWENTFNLVGGGLFTLANSLYNFYENKPSFYSDMWCFGWNSEPFAKGHLQFCPNINLARSLFWIIVYYTQDKLFIDPFIDKVKEDLISNEKKNELADMASQYYEYTPIILAKGLIKKDLLETKKQVEKQAAKLDGPFPLYFKNMNEVYAMRGNIDAFVKEKSDEIKKKVKIIAFFIRLLQGLVSLPLIIHFRSFSISIALDSIIWMTVTPFVDNDLKKLGINKAT